MVSTRSADAVMKPTLSKKGGSSSSATTPAKGKQGGKAAPSPSPAKKTGAAATPPPAGAAAARTTKKGPSSSPRLRWRLLVLGDLLVTALWVFVSCLFSHAAAALIELAGEADRAFALSSRVAALLGDGAAAPAAAALASLLTNDLAVSLAVVCLAIVAFGPLCALFGGALFNPVHNVAFWVSGKHTAALNFLRAAAQVAGGAAGAAAAVRLLPGFVSPGLPGGLKPGVGLGLGCAVEFVLGAALNAVVLFATDTRSAAAAFFAPVLATVALGVAGAAYTGPSLNPAAALAWYLQYGDAHSVEHHLLAFWAAPVAGAAAGGLLYRLVIAPLTGARRATGGGAGRKAAPKRRAQAVAGGPPTPARAATRAAAGKAKKA